MKKSAKALLGAGAFFFGSGLAMNTFVLTRASKKISELKKEIEEKKNPTPPTPSENTVSAMMFSRRASDNALMTKLSQHYSSPKTTNSANPKGGRSVSELMERLNLMKR